jgi:hypothetical protein
MPYAGHLFGRINRSGACCIELRAAHSNLSASYDDDRECARDRSGAKLKFFRCCRGVLSLLRGDEVRFGILRTCDHRSGARLRLYLLQPDISSRRFAVQDGKHSIDIGDEEEVLLRDEIDVAGSCGNLTNGAYMAGTRVDGYKLVIHSCSQQLASCGIDGEAAWGGAGCKWQGGGDFL